MSNLPANRPDSALAPIRPASAGRRVDLAAAVSPLNYKSMMEFATMLARSGLCPRGYQGKPEDILVCMMMGAELGVSHLQALKGIAVINGVATVWGDLGVGLVLNSGQLEYLRETWDEKTQTATVQIKRKGYPEHIETFSMDDARKVPYAEWDKKTNQPKRDVRTLADKDTYKAWPKRMCGWKAKRFACRKEFADILCGLEFAEDRMDMTATEPPPPPLPMQMPRELPQERITQHPQSDHEGDGPCLACDDAPPAATESAYVPDDPVKTYVVESKFDRVVKWVDAKSKAERKAELYLVEFSDGVKAGTFSKTIHSEAMVAAENRCPVKYTTKPGKLEGSLVIVTLVPDIEQPQQDPPAEGAQE